MSTSTTAKPVQSARPAKRAKLVPHDGTLAKQSVAKLDKTLEQLADEARTMEEQLICAGVNAELISPTLVS